MAIFTDVSTFYISLLFADDIILIMYGKTYHESLEILKVLAFTPAIVTVSNYIAILVMIPIGMKKSLQKLLLPVD